MIQMIFIVSKRLAYTEAMNRAVRDGSFKRAKGMTVVT
jgi:hypothetical protein